MPSNVELNAGTGGAIATTKQITHDGDTTQLQGVFLMGIAGTEDAYTAAAVNGDATNGLDVDVTRVIPGTSATHLGKAEDDAHASADVGVMALAVRRDTAAVGSGADGDYSTLNVDGSGRLWTAAVQSGNWNIVNISGTVSLPTGASTAANQTTANGLLTTIDADTGTIAGAVSGTEMQVDVVGALPAGTNNIGDVDVASIAAGDNNIGNVDIVTMPATFAEDAAHTTGDTGVQVLAVRRDADTSLVGTDGDYAPLQVNSTGSLKVAITAGAGSGGTSIADGATFTRNTTSITPAGAVVEAAAPTLTDTDVAGLSMTTAGALRVAVTAGGVAGVVEDAASAGGEEGIMVLAVRRDAASSGVSADGDFAALSVTSDGSLRVSGGGGGTQFAEDAAHTTGDVGTVALAVRRDTAAVGSGTDGDYSTLNVDANGRLHVNVGNTVTVGSHAVTNAGTFATQIDGAALTALQLIDDIVRTDDAAFAPATDEVAMAGFFADEASTDSVDEGDAGAARMTLDRKQIVTPYVHAAAGGQTPYYNLDVDETEDAIKASAGKLFWIHVINRTNALRYIKFYNATIANVTVGTTTPVLSFPVPTQGDTNGAGFTIHFGDHGVQFDTAITVAATTGFADNDTGAPGTNDIILNAGYA